MWIFLDSEALLGGVGKVLPANVSMEEGLDEDDAEGTFELEDDITTSRTKKRIRSFGESGAWGKRISESSAKDDEGSKNFLDKLSDVVHSLFAGVGPSTSVVGAGNTPNEKMLAEKTRMELLVSLQSNSDPNMRARVTEMILAVLGSGIPF